MSNGRSSIVLGLMVQSPFFVSHDLSAIARKLGKYQLCILIVICKRKTIMNNVKSSDLPIWGSLHEAIRWVLYIPVVFGLSIAFFFLFNLLSTFRGDFEGIFLYLQVPLNAGLMATLFVWLALNLAPRAPKTTAWVIYSIWSVFILLSIFRFL